MEHEKAIFEDDQDSTDDIRMSNFSMIIALSFVTMVVVFLFVKIMFD